MTNRNSKGDGGGRALLFIIGFLIIGFLVFVPFLAIAVIHYFRIRRRFYISDNAQRVFQSSSIFKPLYSGISVGAVLAMEIWFMTILLGRWDTLVMPPSAIATLIKIGILSIVLLIISFTIWVAYHVACWMATAYLGVVVDRDSGKVVHPKDMANYSVSDYLKLKFIYELGVMESIPLNMIKRITRQSQRYLFLHGPFGSRGIKFPSKQKRDECLVAIEEAMGVRKTMFEYESSGG